MAAQEVAQALGWQDLRRLYRILDGERSVSRLTDAERRQVIAHELRADAGRSDRAIAEACLASHHTVAKIRRVLAESGQIAQDAQDAKRLTTAQTRGQLAGHPAQPEKPRARSRSKYHIFGEVTTAELLGQAGG